MISFAPTEEQQMIVDTVREFAQERLRQVFRDADETGELPSELIDTGWGLGLVAANIPEAYGGFAADHSAVTGALVAEELAWGDLATALYITAPLLAATPILLGGTEEQKAEYLPRFTGDTFVPATAALIEPRITFDPRQLDTRAERDGDVYVLNGVKAYVPLAADAALLLVWANEGGSTQGFLVDVAAPGLTIGAREQNMGLRALPTYPVTLDNVHVNAACKLGGEQGVAFDRIFNHSLVALASMAVGVARAACEYALDYAKTRETFGAPIATRQAIAFMLAEMRTDIDGARLLAWEAAWRLDQGLDATREARLAKTFADDMVLMVADRAVQILGGHGYIRDYPVELWLRNARGFAMLEGIGSV